MRVPEPTGVTAMSVSAPPGRGWVDRLRGHYHRLLASETFRRRASAFPLTRPLARRRARQLFDLCAGFVYSQVLLACVRLGLFELLAAGPRSTAELAAHCGCDAQATERLLRAACSLELLEQHRDGRFGLGTLGAVVHGDPGLAAMVEHHAVLYTDLADPVALLRGTGSARALAAFWPYAGGGDAAERPAEFDPARVQAYSALMSASLPAVAAQVLDACSLHRHRCLLDVGGGEGRFLEAAATRAPHLRLMLFELPAVAERARARLHDAGLGARVAVSGGDFRRDALPRGADLLSLVRVLFDHDDAAALGILRAARTALEPGATVLLAEPLAGVQGAGPVADAYFGFYLLAMGRGRPRSAAQHRTLLEAAGFTAVRQHATPMPLQAGVITARAL